MKTIGLIGGTSWQSTKEYYEIINEAVEKRFGGHNSARIILNSLNMQTLIDLADKKDWKRISDLLIKEIARLESAGADFFLLCANTLHKFADDICKTAKIPIIHIVEETANKIKNTGIKKVGLLGTRITMTDDFYQNRLGDFGIQVNVPQNEQIDEINEIIFEELTHGIIKKESKDEFISIVNELVNNGAEGVILGCTEIPLLIREGDLSVPMFDTTKIHALAAVERALS